MGDFTALYTNMRMDRTMEVVGRCFAKHPSLQRPDSYSLRLLELTSRNNDFTFNEEIYLQICGTAMDKTYAPGLADIYMEEFDDKATTNAGASESNHFIITGTSRTFSSFGPVRRTSYRSLGSTVYLSGLIEGICVTLHSPNLLRLSI